MARIFVSYSRVDSPFVDDFVPSLRQKHVVWFDSEIKGGQDWWREILYQIQECEIFMYLLSNESVVSNYCENEYYEAIRLQKQFLPVLIRARTQIPEHLQHIQCVDFSSGLKNAAKSWEKLFAAIDFAVSQIPSIPKNPLEEQRTLMPDKVRKMFIETVSTVVENATPLLFAKATDTIYKEILGRNVKTLRGELKLTISEPLRDYLDGFALTYIQLAEILATEVLNQTGKTDNENALRIIKFCATTIGKQVKQTEDILGYDLLTKKPFYPNSKLPEDNQ